MEVNKVFCLVKDGLVEDGSESKGKHVWPLGVGYISPSGTSDETIKTI
jgi:hypothetical protein